MIDIPVGRIKLSKNLQEAEWSSDEAAIDDTMTQMRGKWKDVWGAMGEPEYGVGGA
jgi:hypothetical protein